MKKFKQNNILKIILLLILPFLIELLFFKTINFSKSMIIRIGIIYAIYLLIIFYKIINKYYDNKIDFIIKKIMKYRYIIAIIVFIVMVIFKINFSSSDIWIQYLNEDNSNSSTIIGYPRAIRSDEWLVYTPLMLAQAQNDNWYSQYNENVAQGNYNMMINSLPVANLTILAHPMQWGFLILGQEYGYSWYWAMKMILLILVSIELVMIITKKDEILSLVGGIYLALAPCMMWWLSTSIVDAYIFGISIIVLFNKYIENIEKYKVKEKIFIAIGMIIVIPAFAMTLYPAYQIPLAYLIFCLLLINFISNIKKIKKVDYIIMVTTLFISFFILGYFIIVSWNDIIIQLSTVYPGARFETGGEFTISNFVQYFMNLFLPINTGVPYSNACEVSIYIYPFAATIILLIYTITNKEFKIKENKTLIGLVIVFTLLFIWCYIGFNSLLAKITFLYMSQSSRANLVLGLIGVLISLLLLKKYENRTIFTNKQATIISIIITAISYIILNESSYYSYFSIIKLELTLLIVFSLSYFLLTINKKAYIAIIFIIAMFSGGLVNPISSGTSIFFETDISSEIQNIEKNDKNALWIGSTNVTGQYLMANGVNVLNGVNIYPNFKWLNIVDPEKKYEQVYNRYAHIGIKLGNETNFELVYADNYIVTLTNKDIKDLGIKYIFSLEKYDEEIQKQFNMKNIYTNVEKEQYIYIFE